MAKDVVIKISAKDMASNVLKAVSDSVKKLGAQVARTTAAVTSSVGQVGAKFAKGSLIAVASIGAMASAVTAFGLLSAKVFAGVGDAIDKMAKRSGIGVEALQSLRFAAEQSGSSIEMVEKSIFKLDRAIGDAIGGSTALQDDFAQLGVDIQALSTMSPEKQLEVMADALMAIENPAERAAIGARLMGRGFEELQPLLQEGSEGIQALRSEYDAFGISLSQTDVSNAAELTDAFNRMRSVMRGFITQVGAKLAPTLTAIANKLTELIKPAMEVVNAFDFGAMLQGVVGGISNAVSRITSFVSENINIVRGVAVATKVAFEVVGGIVSSVASGIGAAFSGVSGALGGFQNISKAVLTGFVQGLTFVETAVANLPVVFDIMAQTSSLKVLTFVNDVTHWFTTVLPNAVKTFGVMVMNGFAMIVKGGVDLFKSMIDRVAGLLSKLASFDPTGIVAAHVAALEQGSRFLDAMSDSVKFAQAPAAVQPRAETPEEAAMKARIAASSDALASDFEARLGPRMESLSAAFDNASSTIKLTQEKASEDMQLQNEATEELAASTKSQGVQAAQSRLLTRGIARDPQKELVNETKKQTKAAEEQSTFLERIATAVEGTGIGTQLEVVG